MLSTAEGHRETCGDSRTPSQLWEGVEREEWRRRRFEWVESIYGTRIEGKEMDT